MKLSKKRFDKSCIQKVLVVALMYPLLERNARIAKPTTELKRNFATNVARD